MAPTLPMEDIVVIDQFSEKILKRKYEKGDVVVAWAPYDPKRIVCKRIGAVAGEKVDETMGKCDCVPQGHVWLIGDNLSESIDSRSYGPGKKLKLKKISFNSIAT
jgi:hypothetical protein